MDFVGSMDRMDRLANMGHEDRAPEQQLTKVSCVVLFHYYFRQCLCFVTHFYSVAHCSLQ